MDSTHSNDLEQQQGGIASVVYNRGFKLSVGCFRAPMSSDCTIQEGLLWTSLILGLSILLLLSNRGYLKCSRKNRLPTPPGSRGWPLIGETFAFVCREDTAEFVHRRAKRYGEIFYSNIIGSTHLMVHRPGFLRFMLTDPNQVLTATLPESSKKLLGPTDVGAVQGQAHTALYSLTLKSLSTKYHDPWIAGFNDIMRRTVDSWKGRTINCHHDSQKMFVETGFVYIFGMVNSDQELRERVSRDAHEISKGLVSVPIDFPGMGFRRGLQARKNLNRLLAEKVKQHLKMREEGVKHQFYSMMEFFLDNREQSGKALNSDDPDCIQTICDQVSIALFGQFENIAILFAWLMKFLSENPEVLQEVQAEQDAIRRSKEDSNYTITRQDLDKMKYSWQVLNETLRLATLVGTLLREVETEFEYEGFTIPKGWTLHAALRAFHYNPEYFPNPTKFDPSRFQDPANITTDTFLPFGFGNRGCLGKTVVKSQIVLLMHYVSTRLRWTALDPAAPTKYTPIAHIKGGYPIRVYES